MMESDVIRLSGCNQVEGSPSRRTASPSVSPRREGPDALDAPRGVQGRGRQAGSKRQEATRCSSVGPHTRHNVSFCHKRSADNEGFSCLRMFRTENVSH